VVAARQVMDAQLTRELAGLRELRRLNGAVREEEIQALKGQRQILDLHLKAP